MAVLCPRREGDALDWVGTVGTGDRGGGETAKRWGWETPRWGLQGGLAGATVGKEVLSSGQTPGRSSVCSQGSPATGLCGWRCPAWATGGRGGQAFSRPALQHEEPPPELPRPRSRSWDLHEPRRWCGPAWPRRPPSVGA